MKNFLMVHKDGKLLIAGPSHRAPEFSFAEKVMDTLLAIPAIIIIGPILLVGLICEGMTRLKVQLRGIKNDIF